MRVLHPRHDYVGGRASAQQSRSVRSGNPRSPGGKPLPLYGLYQDLPVGEGCGGDHGRLKVTRLAARKIQEIRVRIDSQTE